MGSKSVCGSAFMTGGWRHRQSPCAGTGRSLPYPIARPFYGHRNLPQGRTTGFAQMPSNMALALTSKAALPYKPRDLKGGDPDSWRFSGAEAKSIRRRAGEPPPVDNGKRRMTREADLSTEQAGAQAPSRIPRPHGDQRRPQGAQQAARARPQAAECLSGAAGRHRHGATEAAGRFPGRRRRGEGGDCGLRPAGARARTTAVRFASASPCRRRSATRSSATASGADCGKS